MDDVEIEEIMRLQAGVDAAPAGQVRRDCDGSIAYRTTKPRDDVEAWLIVLPDGRTVGAGYLTVEDVAPLLRWVVLQ